MSIFIFLSAIIILICLVLNKVTNKLGMPMLLAFILLGMVFGSDGFFKIDFDNYTAVEHICSIALIFIMFYGGFGTNWSTARPVAVKSVLLSSLGVVFTAITTGLFCYFVLKVDFWESMLIGSVISSTDAASVFSILRSKQLNLRDYTAPMLEVESGSNDPFSYMLTVIVLSVMSGEFSGVQLVYMIFAQIVFGVAFGVATAFVATLVLSKMENGKDGTGAIFTFSIALISYSGAAVIGGNGYLSAYIAGIILGNKSFRNKKALVHFFDGITGLMQMLIFFLLGLLSFPSQLPKVVLPALAIALFVTFISRPLSVFTILAPFKSSLNQKLLVSWAGLRGASSIVFAIMATNHPAYMKHDVFHIVFFIVLFSISIQGTLIPIISKKLHMIDNDSNIMKTFSDYSDEIPIQFLKLSISSKHPWVGQKVKDIKLLPELILALILRGNERIVPKGNTTILQGDLLVLSALSLDDDIVGSLTELRIEKDSIWLGKSLAEISLGDEKLIVAIMRNNKAFIPNGKTIVKEHDVFVISQL